jgi:hypothetical protein
MFDSIVQCGSWLESFFNGAAYQLGQSLVLVVIGGAPAVGWLRSFLGRQNDQNELDAHLERTAHDRKSAVDKPHPVIAAEFSKIVALFDSDLRESLKSNTLPEFKRQELATEFWERLSKLRSIVPGENSVREAFSNYDQSVDALLTHTRFGKRKSQTLYTLFDAVKAAFKQLQDALGFPLTAEEAAAYDRHGITPTSLHVLYHFLFGEYIDGITRARRKVYSRLGVSESAFH